MNMIELKVFTNCTHHIKNHQTIHDTIKSFENTFGQYPMQIFVDRNPNLKDSDDYIHALKERYSDVQISDSLSDGYIKAINQSKSEFLFMLEHDWSFIKERIHHKLEEICDIMKRDSLHHLRFNRFDNNYKKKFYGTKTYLEPIFKCEEYIKVRAAANNPHLIYSNIYKRDLMKYIKKDKSSFGIEQNLENSQGNFAIYGSINHQHTITHTDGRKSWRGLELLKGKK